MSEQAIFEKVTGILTRQMSLKNVAITMDTQLINDLGADSVDLVGAVMTFEDEFGISIPDEDLQGIVTIGDAVKAVAKNL